MMEKYVQKGFTFFERTIPIRLRYLLSPLRASKMMVLNGLKYFLVSTPFGEDEPILTHIFQMG